MSLAPSEWERLVWVELRENGLRTTNVRINTIRTISQLTELSSGTDIRNAMLSQGQHVDVVTVYRTIDLLAEIGRVIRVGSLVIPKLLDDSDTGSVVRRDPNGAHEVEVSDELARAIGPYIKASTRWTLILEDLI